MLLTLAKLGSFFHIPCDLFCDLRLPSYFVVVQYYCRCYVYIILNCLYEKQNLRTLYLLNALWPGPLTKFPCFDVSLYCDAVGISWPFDT